MNKTIILAMVLGLGSVAVAGDGKDAKAPAPKAPDKAMEMPKAPKELADMMKAMEGTWKCTGKGMGMDGAMIDMTGTLKSKTDMNGFWAHDTWTSKMGKADFTFESYTTFDAGMKKWRRVMVDNFGGQMIGLSDGMKDNKMEFAMDAWGPMGQAMAKDHTDISDMKAGVKMWGETSMDKGKTWKKEYEVVCKK